MKPYLWQTEKTDIHFLPDKIVDGNKGTFGKILVVAGSPGMCGAAYLSASGAFAVGIGMVKIVTAEENQIPRRQWCRKQCLTVAMILQKILTGAILW